MAMSATRAHEIRQGCWLLEERDENENAQSAPIPCWWWNKLDNNGCCCVILKIPMNKLQCWGGKLTTIETNWHIFTVTANGCFVLIRNSLVFAVVIHVLLSFASFHWWCLLGKCFNLSLYQFIGSRSDKDDWTVEDEEERETATSSQWKWRNCENINIFNPHHRRRRRCCC